MSQSFPCFVLAQGLTSSFAYLGMHTLDVTKVVRTAEKLAIDYNHGDVERRVDLMLYQPSHPLDFIENEAGNRLLEIVDNTYLAMQCTPVSTGGLDDDPPPKLTCVIAIVRLHTNYIIFMSSNARKDFQYITDGEMRGLPREIVGLVQKTARETFEELEIQERGVVGIDVYETRRTLDSIIEDQSKISPMRAMSRLTVGDEIQPPSGLGCLFVEIKTAKYLEFIYFTFRRDMGRQDYIYLAEGTAQGFPTQTLDVVGNKSRGALDGTGGWDAGTMNAHVSVYRPKGKYKTEEDLRDLQLTAEILDSEFSREQIQVQLRQAPNILLITLVISALGCPLVTIQEEANGIDRAAAIESACHRESPSVGSKHSALSETQCENRTDAIRNYRPRNLTGPPVQIFHPAFVTFIRTMSNSCDTMDFSHSELDNAFDFIDVSLTLHKDESERRTKLHNLEALGHLYSSEITLDIKTIKPDGTTRVRCPSAEQEAIVRIVELKNEIGEGGSDPIAQAECGFVLVCASKTYELFRNASCFPMFLVGVAGPNLTVSGAIFMGQFVSQRLTDYIYLGPLPTYQGSSALDHSIRRVAQVLRALNQATNELTSYYSSLKFESSSASKSRFCQPTSPCPPLVPSHPVPQSVVPPSFRTFTVDGAEYMVDYESRLPPPLSSRAVFKGTVMRKGDQKKHNVVVKFTATYCAGAHQRLANAKRAPHLWFCEPVESVGMHVVVMGHEDGMYTDSLITDKEHIRQLREAVQLLHEEDYVHGDIRLPNVLITSTGLKLIDFDWCGKEGTARYPADIFLVPERGWHEGVRRGGLIAKDHDQHMVNLLTDPEYLPQATNPS